MSRKTKAEYEDLIGKTRGKLPASQPGEDYDLPPASERIRRLAEIQCNIGLDILMVLRQIDRKLGEMKLGVSLPQVGDAYFNAKDKMDEGAIVEQNCEEDS